MVVDHNIAARQLDLPEEAGLGVHEGYEIRIAEGVGRVRLCRDPEINFLFRILELIFQYRMDKDAQLTQKWEKIQAQAKSSLGSELPSLEELAEDPRLEEILKLTNDYRLPEEKVLILADHRDTVEKIADQLQALGLPASHVWGSQIGEQKGMTGKKKI